MGRVILLLIVLGTSGCSVLSDLAAYGAQANDEAVKDAKFFLCKGASIGSVMREFNTKEKVEGWVQICLGDVDTPPLMLEAIDE